MSTFPQFDSSSQPAITPIRSWSAAILLLDAGVEPLEITFQGPVPVFCFPRVEATVILSRYSRLKDKLSDMVDAARAAARRGEVSR